MIRHGQPLRRPVLERRFDARSEAGPRRPVDLRSVAREAAGAEG